jgi:nicotinamide mononucleotide adenylyltransferase
MINNESEKLRESRGPGRPKGSGKKMKPLLKLRSKRESYGGEEVEVAPVAKIEDDYKAIKKNPKLKMSVLSLKHLKDRKVISSDQFATYQWSHTLPEERTIITEKNVVEHVNLKLVSLYESI